MEGIREVKFIAFKDEKDEVVEGMFTILETTDNYIKIKTSKNILTLPWVRVLKIKEPVEDLSDEMG